MKIVTIIIMIIIIIIIQFKANYKVSTTEEKKQNIHKQYTKFL
jgi:Zn-dependent membrane protease YugP